MKRYLIILIITISWSAQAQEEQISVEESTETMDTAQFSGLVQTYNRIIRAQEEKLSLFKVDLTGPFFFLVTNWGDKDDATNAVVNLAYEKKFRPNWSWNVESAFISDRSDRQEILETVGIRYYYNMKKRMLKGKSANNFSGNYLTSTVTYGHRFRDSDSQVTWNLLFGIQRRLGKRFFFDLNMGFESIFNAYQDRETGLDLLVTGMWGLAF